MLHPLKMFAPLPVGLALLLLCPAYFHFLGDRLLGDGEEKSAVTPARTQSYFAKSYGIDGDDGTNSPSAPRTARWSACRWAKPRAMHDAPLLLALRTGNESRLAPLADARIWVGSVLGAMGQKQRTSRISPRTTSLHMSARLPARVRRPGSQPARAGISEAVVVPPTSPYISKTAGELQLRHPTPAQPARDQPRQAR